MTAKVVIVRGITGSGKSHYADGLIATASVNTIDAVRHFYVSDDSDERYDCLGEFAEMLANGNKKPRLTLIECASVEAVEAIPFYALALAYELDVEIVTMLCSTEHALKYSSLSRSSKFPKSILKEALDKLRVDEQRERKMFPAEWKHTIEAVMFDVDTRMKGPSSNT